MINGEKRDENQIRWKMSTMPSGEALCVFLNNGTIDE